MPLIREDTRKSEISVLPLGYDFPIVNDSLTIFDNDLNNKEKNGMLGWIR